MDKAKPYPTTQPTDNIVHNSDTTIYGWLKYIFIKDWCTDELEQCTGEASDLINGKKNVGMTHYMYFTDFRCG